MHQILLGGQPIGQARIEREGLYYRFSCRCRLSGEVVYRLVARCGERVESLGIPVPEGRDFVLRTRIPVKRLGEGEISLSAVPKQAQIGGKFLPLCPEEPFKYLKRLQDAHLERRGGRLGVVIAGEE